MSDTTQTDPVQTVSDQPEPAAKTVDGLYLVDGSGFIFRAFHAIPPLTRSDGTPVNAVMGFTNMLMKLLADHHAEAVAVIFDSKRLNFRNEFYADYKAHRPEPPEELKPQFGIIREAVEAFCVPSIELEGYEADDLIATYARLAREQGRQVTIVSSDKDLMQLVTDGVAMLDPMKNKVIGFEEVFEKFGVTPDKVVDVQALAGDPVDNVPGVPGIGIKTAAQLIGEYGDLETLLERAGEIKQPKRRQALIDNAELARVSKRLVQLDDQAPVPTPLDDLKVREPDHEKLLNFLRQQGFRSIITRVENEIRADGRLVDGAAAPSGSTPTSASATALPTSAPEVRASARFDGKGTYELVQTVEALDRWIAAAHAAGTVAVDTETDSLHACSCKMVGISLAVEQGAACYIPVGHVGPDGVPAEGSLDLAPSDAPPQLPVEEVVARLKPLLEDPAILKVGHNLKFDIQVFGGHGIRLAPIDDTMLISYVLETGLHGHGMDELSKLHCDYTPITYDQVTGTGKSRVTFDRVALDKATEYAAEDADVTLRLYQALKPRLVPERLTTLYETIERPLVPIIADMEAEGILVDCDVLKELSKDLASRLAELEIEIHRVAGHTFNVGSPKQLGDVLFGEMGLQGGKKGKTGAYSTDSATLEPLAEQGHDIVQKVLDWRQFSKLKSTYTDSLQQQIDAKTGRVHTSFSLAITTTGRLSSNDPNLQNIPIRTEEGRKIRRAFIAKPGHTLLSVDYSQIELRLVAEMAGIEALKHAFREGIDIHAMTASQVFGVPLDQMTGDIRRKAKAINFGIIYGISGFGLGRQLGISAGEANSFIKTYLERFSELAAFMDKTKEFCRKNGYVTTLFGRRCHIQGIAERNPARRQFAERQAINAPIQGTAADIIKRAMVRIPSALEAAGLTGRMLLQVHDELIFEVPEAEAAETSEVVRRVMEGAASLGVPLVAEAGTGHSWADAH
ncbi:DNA polymerase [Skermanella stibiiresistens SB22]|uniref:DNA polymerase I n=1 Tax=Skermanella stibiiresistens SB22 TaxID=1385369 RepID=W9H8S8_9PROT|nr:DNA polymerase I [Skermanella stibiiresistens]EWY42655.1 DNA polymerase [Skermanella stibiiresistens SB22]